MDIINERTVGMDFEEYKVRRKKANSEIKNRKKGNFIFIAAEKGIKKGKTYKRQK